MNEKIREILFRNKICPEVNFTDDSSIEVYLEESIDWMEFISNIEEEFDIEIDADEISEKDFCSINTVARMIEKYECDE